MFSTNFHTFVLISSLIYYIILRKSRKTDTFSKQYILYVLYFPVVLYACHYFFASNSVTPTYTTLQLHLPTKPKTMSSSDNLISRPYPDSLSA